MSLDALYLLVYDPLPYVEPTPMEKDIKYLRDKYGGYFEEIESCTIFWDKPKYTLNLSELKILLADQVLERQEGENWKIIK